VGLAEKQGYDYDWAVLDPQPMLDKPIGLEDLKTILTGALVDLVLLCFRAWLLSCASSYLFPSLALDFWQWGVVVMAVRALLKTSAPKS
jgi:hypothetical protein